MTICNIYLFLIWAGLGKPSPVARLSDFRIDAEHNSQNAAVFPEAGKEKAKAAGRARQSLRFLHN